MDVDIIIYSQCILHHSYEFNRIKVVLVGNLEKQFPVPIEVFFATVAISTFWGIVCTILEFKNEKRFPLKPGAVGFLFQFVTVVSLLVPKVLLISTAVIQAPYVYAIGLSAEFLLISLYNWLIFGSRKGIFFNSSV
jgi:hypothetical protein